MLQCIYIEIIGWDDIVRVLKPTDQQLHWITTQSSPLRNLRLELQSQRIRLQKGFDRLLCLDEITLEPRPWQTETALKVLRDMQGNALLADEVGLGKTIEAGLILKELIVRSMVKSLLILVPSPLVEQWREEIAEKFGIELYDVKDSAWEEQPYLICSVPRMVRSEPIKRHLSKRVFDLLIVDEAHCLRDHKTSTYKTIYGIQKKNTLLLSATPIQNDLRELYNLVNVLRPGHLQSRKRFRKEYMVDRFTPKNVQKLKQLLNDVMIRHRRSNTLVELPARRVHSIENELSDVERSFHNGVVDFCRQIYKKYVDGMMPIGWDQTPVHLIVLILLSLLKQNCSSPQSTLGTLRNKILPQLEFEDKVICEKLIGIGESITVPSKAIELLKHLMKTDEQAIVYSQYLATIEVLKDTFEEHGISVVTYSGELSATEKQVALKRFRSGEKRVFLSTESGGQGLNLQFCNRLYNYDLPWNPMRIEQRIGRVHRFGQTKDVHIYTMPTKGTIDEYLLYILTSKVNLFEMVIGELDTILSYMKDDKRSFDKRIGTIILESKDSSEIEQYLRAIGEEIVRARKDLDTHVDQATKTLNQIGVGI